MAIAIKKLDEKGSVARYLIKGVSPVFINAVRRTVMLHVPCLAVEDVLIYENDSVMFDEFLTHRLGLLALKTDVKTYKAGDKVKLVLEKEGPCTVYSKDIKSTDPKIEVMDKNVPITKLSKDQRIKLEMQAVMNSGKEHAKWIPAVIGYREIPSLAVGKDCNACKDCVEACPVNVLEMKGNKVVLEKPNECILCGACVDICKKEALKLKFEESGLIFSIEPITGLSGKEVISSAVKELLEKSKTLGKEIKKAK